jgi:diguanylate cyclase (GGDEF)-like protein
MTLRLARKAMAWLPLALITVIGVALSIYASILGARYGEAQARAEFEREALGEIGALKVSINASLGAVTSLAALYEARGSVEPSEFKRFADTLLASDPSIQALEWAKVVNHDQRSAVERQMSTIFGSDFHFTERSAHGNLIVAGQRPRYVPVIYVVPLPGNEPAMAFDLMSEATRRAAVEQAERTGEQVASGRIVPVQTDEYSILLFRPIFAVAEPPRPMTGLVLGLFRLRDIVATARAGANGNRVRLLLVDRSAPEAEQLLYPRNLDGRLAELLSLPGVTSDVTVGGRSWHIVAQPAERDPGYGPWEGRIALGAGLLLTGNLAGYVLLVMRRRQISEREGQIRIQEARATMDHMRQALVRFDRYGRLLVANHRFTSLFRLHEDEVRLGLSMQALLVPPTQRGTIDAAMAELICETLQMLATDQVQANTTCELGSGLALAILYQPMDDGGWLVTFEDIAERQVAEAKMMHMAHHDALTDLANRTLFRTKLQQALADVAPDLQVGLLYLDLDEFKTVNDTLGHPVGDQLLQAVTQRLLARVRKSDVVARLGGDEFAVVLPIVDRSEEITGLASRLIEAIRAPFDLDGAQITIGTSIGIASAPTDGNDPDELLQHADVALYQAKLDGRGIFRSFQPEMDARVRARRAMEGDLREALAMGQFALHYQPQVDLQEGVVSGVEALIRWFHPRRGFVPPSEFIPLAEETGLIEEIGEFVLRQACETAASWPSQMRIAVNVSPVQLRSPRLLGAVQEALRTSGLPPRRLELEVTETAILHDTEANLTALTALHDLGLSIALDDFGTGYSSLSYLSRFPFDRLKIDQSFVGKVELREDCLAIVRAICSLARQLDLKTTAEGVETEAQLAAVTAAGCIEVQGYLFSAPVPVGAIPALLARLEFRLAQLRGRRFAAPEAAYSSPDR